MRVLLVHLSDGPKGGGGGVAVQRLHYGLQDAGVESNILCRLKTLDSPQIATVPRLSRIEFPIKRITNYLGLNDIHLVGSFKVKSLEMYKEADVIDFQGIHTNTLSYLALPSLAKEKPAVFTMHDMWAATGHCTYSYDCVRWKSGCGKCPYPETHPRIKRDNTRLEWRLKKHVYSRSNMAFVAGSRWLVDVAQQSMFGEFPIYRIPNGVNTEIFKPLDREACRAKLGIPQGKNVLMFAALKLKDYRKGSDLLLEALQGLPTSLKSETVLLTFGNGDKSLSKEVGIESIDLGYVTSDHEKAVAYSAADLFLFPTRADAFGLVSIESQACGTPVVSFNVGGVPDHVHPGVTGYLAEPGNVSDFRAGVMELLEDDVTLSQMREQCRRLTVQNFRFELRVQRFITLYRALLENSTVPTDDDLISTPLALDTAHSI